jgi:hypothetical protein
MAREVGYESLEYEIVGLCEDQKQILVALYTLFDLLEEYAPCWYTEKHHERALAALAVSASDASMQKHLVKGNELECKRLTANTSGGKQETEVLKPGVPFRLIK